jgi:molybdenum cofactor biosynthesis enzyme MoaA
MEIFDDGLFNLIKILGRSVPWYIFSGIYSEPTLNIRLLDFITEVKRTGANYGLHTNGVLLPGLQDKQSFVSKLLKISDEGDYLTVSLDAGLRQSFAITKGVAPIYFDNVVQGLELFKNRDRKRFRLTIAYLLNENNNTEQEICRVVSIAKSVEADALRFSIPYAPYGSSFNDCVRYKNEYELPFSSRIEEVMERVSLCSTKKLNVFFLPPSSQDIENCFCAHCFNGYYEITLGADGFFYKCSSTASHLFSKHRLGPLTSNIKDFHNAVVLNQDYRFNPLHECLPVGARCTRAALEINNMLRLGTP